MNSSSNADKVSHKILYYIIAGVLIVAGFAIIQWGILYILIGAAFIYLVFRTYSSQHSLYSTFDPNATNSQLVTKSEQDTGLLECPSCGLKQKSSSKFCKSCGYNFQSQ